MLNTSKYHSRYFNNVYEHNDLIIKSSTNIKKIKSEYKYYYYLPDSAKRFFVQPFNLKVSSNIASYEMEKINVENLAKIALSNNLSKESFSKILYKVSTFKQQKIIYKNNAKKQSEYLVLEKTFNRIKQIKNVDDEIKLFKRLHLAYEHFSKERKDWSLSLSHGDLCLSNILWIDSNSVIKFIDPRGALRKKDLFLDSYYDIAKMSHSINGGYENIIYSMPTKLDYLKDVFNKYIEDLNISYELLRVYEASLFLSMIPLHINNTNNILMFRDVCDTILKEVGF